MDKKNGDFFDAMYDKIMSNSDNSEAAKPEGFVETPMPKLYFDHDKTAIPAAMGVSKKRAKQLQRDIEDFLEDSRESKKRLRFTEQLEGILALAQNEQERIFLAVESGKAQHNSSSHIHEIKGSELPDELKKAILRKLLGGLDDHDRD